MIFKARGGKCVTGIYNCHERQGVRDRRMPPPSHLCLQDLIDHALRDRHVLNKRAHLVLNVTTALELAPHRRGLDLMTSAHGVEGR